MSGGRQVVIERDDLEELLRIAERHSELNDDGREVLQKLVELAREQDPEHDELEDDDADDAEGDDAYPLIAEVIDIELDSGLSPENLAPRLSRHEEVLVDRIRRDVLGRA